MTEESTESPQQIKEVDVPLDDHIAIEDQIVEEAKELVNKTNVENDGEQGDQIKDIESSPKFETDEKTKVENKNLLVIEVPEEEVKLFEEP